MKINDVEKITGLSKKAIRLYESKGLISIARDANGYRNYTNENIEVLKSIRLLRSVGASISDIKLYLFGVISINELMDKRKSEILKESGKNSEIYQLCESITDKENLEILTNINSFTDEAEEIKLKNYGALSVGIDIGTTTVSAVVYDIDNKEQLDSYSVPHNSYVYSDIRSEQDVNIIMDKSQKLLYHILDTYEGVVSIGITGQMHGILYINSKGNAISNLINWQDKRADRVLENGKNACQRIYDITGERVATGYGIATHYYNMIMEGVPSDATGILSIMDYFAMKICGNDRAITHPSVASSLGLFDVQSGEFKYKALNLLGIDREFLPCVTKESVIIGKCRQIPVSVPLGDNQASFLGSVGKNSDTILINIGTGSQISMVSDYKNVSGDIEIRPFIEGKYLICGSALCGGFAYSMLEEFFRSYIISCGMADTPQYEIINKLARDAYENGEDGLLVDTAFLGKRSNPQARGSINNIGRENFTPSNLVLGVLKGICNELYELYEEFSEKKAHIVASGGAVRKNQVLKRLIANRFEMSVSASTQKEEAATGVALFSAFAIGKIEYKNGFSEYICYREND